LLREYNKADGPEKEIKKSLADFHREAFKDGLERANSLTQEIHHAYAKVRLHFKPNDLSFSRVEHKFDYCMSRLAEIKEEKEVEKLFALKEQVHSAANEITMLSRSILKAEWETVKLGEPAYKNTKRWSIWICVVMFFLLITIGVHAGISYVKVNDKKGDAALSTNSK
jgi:hypothetical protein